MITFVAFCAISSAGYLFNDLRDREHDRLHHEKRLRPIASGQVAAGTASTTALVLARGGDRLGFAVDPEVAGLVALYGVITAAYSLGLKRLVIIDVMTIASLFILRVVAGAVAVGAQASEFLLDLHRLAGPVPRLHQAPPGGHHRAGGEEAETRPVLEHYSIPFLDQMISMVTATAIISYVIYTVDSPRIGSDMLATVPSVLYGIFRYLYLIYDRHDTRSTPAILTEDPGMIFAGLPGWATALLMLYVVN